MLSVLAPILINLGAPILGSILRDKLGGVAGDASARVVEALAEKFGAEPNEEAIADAIKADADAAAKVRAIEDERRPEWIA